MKCNGKGRAGGGEQMEQNFLDSRSRFAAVVGRKEGGFTIGYQTPFST